MTTTSMKAARRGGFDAASRMLDRRARAVCAAAAVVLASAACGDRATGPDGGGARGDLVSNQLLQTFPKAVIAQQLTAYGASASFTARYDAQQYRITYRTVDPSGATVTVSGAVWLPVSPAGAVPLMSYSHGTVTVKNDVPSNSLSQEGLGVGAINASHGSVIALADYVGLGASSALPHPYLHAATEAAAGMDALRAARKLAASKGVALDGHLFVFGYSQGGHAAMALHRELEQHASGEFTVTAAAPMSGPYDMTNTALAYLDVATADVAGSIKVAYLAGAYQSVYHVASGLDAVVRPQYATLANKLVTSGATYDELAAGLAPVPRDNLQPSVVTAIRDDPQSPLRVALRDNDVYDWAPRAPVRLYYATADEQVPYQNALTAEARMRALGATDVQAVNLGPLSHGGAVIPAFVAARAWFDGFLH